MAWNLRHKLSARSLEKKAAGPFSPELFSALRNNSCMNCGGVVHDSEMFGNALVVEPRQVVLSCRLCRGGEPWPSDKLTHPGDKYDIDGVIYEIHQHRDPGSLDTETGTLLDWYEVLVCLRLGRAVFQSIGYPPTKDAFRGASSFRLDDFDELPSTGCGDCFAVWSTAPYPEQTGWQLSDSWNETECMKCGLKHELQWHRRISLSEERKLLLGR